MHWNARISARYDLIADLRWSKCAYIARPLSARWAGKFQPILAVSSSRLVVGAGSKIYFYSFGVPNNSSAPPVSFEGSASLLDRLDCPRNITALTFIEDGGLDRSLDIAFQDGSIERIYLSTTPTITTALTITRHKLLPMAKNDFAESLCSQSEIILALSSTGQARLSTLSGSLTSTLDLKARSWTSHLCISASTPYAAFGTASKTPLTVHPILDGGHLRSQPIAILHTVTSSQTDLIPFEGLSSSAVYGLSQGPLNSPWGTSPQILVSGWYDGQVRIYDLRSSPSFSAHRRPLSSDNPSNCTASVAVHRPVLSLVDRWSYEPIYSVASGGGSAAHVAAGTARHSVVSFWDIRQPTQGWSVHAPGNDSSPVYSIVMESSRFFGVTQSRPFVYDFVSRLSRPPENRICLMRIPLLQ